MNRLSAIVMAIAMLAPMNLPASGSLSPKWVSKRNAGGNSPLQLSISDDGNVAANYIKSFRYLDGKTGRTLWRHSTLKGLLFSVGVDSLGRRIVAIDTNGREPADGYILLFDKAGRVLWRHSDPQDSLTIAYDGKHILMDGEDAGYTIIECNRGRFIVNIPKPKQDLWNAWFTSDGSKVFACSPTAIVAYQANGKSLWRYSCSGGIQSVATSSNGSRSYVLLGVRNQRIVALDRKGVAFENISAPPDMGSPSGWRTAACSANGDLVLLTSDVNNPRYLALDRNGRPLWWKTFKGQGSRISAKVLPYGFAVVAGNSLSFMDRRGKIVSTATVSDHVLPWGVSPNGRYAAVGMADSRVALYAVPDTLARAPKPSGILPAQTHAPSLVHHQADRSVAQTGEKMRKDEQWAKEGGHMPWRRDALSVASVDGLELLGLSAQMAGARDTRRIRDVLELSIPGTTARFHMINHSLNAATVRVSVDGKTRGDIRLQRPLGYWWHITSYRVVHRPKSRRKTTSRF